MNDNKLKNKPVPYNYARCFNEHCPKAPDCLRHVAALHTTADTSFISIVNPVSIPTDSTACPYFKTAEKMHVAWESVIYWIKYPSKMEPVSATN